MPPRSYFTDPRVSDYLAYARAFFPSEYAAAKNFIENTGFPYIASSSHIAAYMGISPSLVRQVLHKPEYHYRHFELSKSHGAPRLISTPKTYLKVMQWWICDNVLFRVPVHDCVHGFRRGRSYVSNANAHSGATHVLNVDVKSFFDNIKSSDILNLFLSCGYGEAGSLVLTSLCSNNGAAPTGAPTSPAIANAIMMPVDIKIDELARAEGLVYTRYADDITLSGQSWIDKELLSKIEGIVSASDFQLNKNKTKFMGPGDRIDVTGLVINDGPNLPREWRNWARGYLHRVKLNASQMRSHTSQVRGIYGVLVQLDPERKRKITVLAEQTLIALREAGTHGSA